MKFRNMGIVSALSMDINAINSANAVLTDYYSECMGKYDSINNSRIYECTGYADQKYKTPMSKAYNNIYKSLKFEGRNPTDADDFEKS